MSRFNVDMGMPFKRIEFGFLWRWMELRLRRGRTGALCVGLVSSALLACGALCVWRFSPFNGLPIWSAGFSLVGLALTGTGGIGFSVSAWRVVFPVRRARQRSRSEFLELLQRSKKPFWVCTECRVRLESGQGECPSCLSSANRFLVSSDRDVDLVGASMTPYV